ncbi:MAG: neutral zinc metallopeptidase [Chloroflexota bacterium]
MIRLFNYWKELVFLGTVLAATLFTVQLVNAAEISNCYVAVRGGWADGGDALFPDCAVIISENGDLTSRNLVYGSWRGYTVVVDQNDGIYYRYGRFGQFRYWGTVVDALAETDVANQTQEPGEPTPEPATPIDPTGDADRDGFIGAADRCPREAEVINGVFDGDGCADTIDDLLSFAANDLDAYWRDQTEALGLTYYPPTRLAPYRNPANSRLRMNAFYTSYGHYIGYDMDLMESALNRFGDFAPVAILAHEWAHLSQRNIGIQREYTISTELQADCLAGAYAFHLQEQGNLEEGDLEEGLYQMYSIGDPAGTPWFHDNAHGTSEQRYTALLNGFNEGVLYCLETY